MSRNVSGVYSLPAGYRVVNGDTSDAAQHTPPLEDIAADLNAARPIVAGGTGAATPAGARASLRVPSGVEFPDRTAAEAATVASDVRQISYLDTGRVVTLTRDPAGTDLTTLDGAKWSHIGEGFRDFKDLPTLLANTSLVYGSGASKVAAGDVIRTRAEGFSYQVAASGATDHHLTTAGGVKLYVLAGADGYNVKAFGAAGDGVTDDTAAIQASFDAVQQYGSVIFPPSSFNTNGVISLTQTDVTIDFQGTTFSVGDTGTSADFTVASSNLVGKVGFLFDQCDRLKLIGAVRMEGRGTVGTTSLAGIVFSDCDDLAAEATMQFAQMAAGRFAINCNRPVLGNAYGDRMDGLQTFQSPPTDNQGSVEVLIGCQYGRSGDVISFDGEKPARYMSVGFGRNNIAMACGASVIEHDGSSLTGHALAIRSAIDCSFGPVIAVGGVTRGLLLQRNAGDVANGYLVDRVSIASVIGVTGSTGASVDALVSCSNSDTAPNFGTISIGTVSGTCAGEFAIQNDAVKMFIGHAFLSGSAAKMIQINNPVGSDTSPELHINDLVIGPTTTNSELVLVGNGALFQCDNLVIPQGPTGTSPAVIEYANVGFGTHHNGIHINNVRYKQNGSANNFTRIVRDSSSLAGVKKVSILNTIASDATEDLILVSQAYFARSGKLLSTAIPTTGTWEVNDQIWDYTPVSGAAMGWVCTVAGNPGTWVAMSNFA